MTTFPAGILIFWTYATSCFPWQCQGVQVIRQIHAFRVVTLGALPKLIRDDPCFILRLVIFCCHFGQALLEVVPGLAGDELCPAALRLTNVGFFFSRSRNVILEVLKSSSLLCFLRVLRELHQFLVALKGLLQASVPGFFSFLDQTSGHDLLSHLQNCLSSGILNVSTRISSSAASFSAK